MNKKLDIHNFWRSNIFIILMFVIMSVMSGILMYHSHFIGVGWDIEFHWQRIYEIRNSILHNNFFPIVSLNEFSQSGSLVMSMYPKINLIPLAILTFIIKSQIALYNIGFMFGSFLCFLISYFSSYTYKSYKVISFIFSVSYTLSNLVFACYYNGSSLGTLTSVYFLPLVLFGFLSLIEKNKWIELSIGMIGIIFSHVLSTGITILFLIIFFLINLKKFRRGDVILSLINSIVVTVLVTSVFWIPFIIFKLNNNLNIPSISYIQGNSFSLLYLAFDNPINGDISTAGIIGLILSIINYKKLSCYLKQLFFISIMFIFMASSLFPWSILSHTPIIHLQYPSRLYIIPQVILCYLFAVNMVIIMKKIQKKTLAIVLIILSLLFLQLGAQETLVNSYSSRPDLTSPYNYDINFIIRNNKEFDNILNSGTSSPDYYPQASMSSHSNIYNHLSTYGNNKNLYTKTLGNGGFSFKAPQKINKLSLPFLYYNSIDYQVKLDGKTVKGYPNNDAFMTINNVHKGKHHVQIIVHKTKAEIASYILSVIGLLILIGTILKNFLKKRKNK